MNEPSERDCPERWCIRGADHVGGHIDGRGIFQARRPEQFDVIDWNLKPLVPWWHRARRPKVRPIFAWYDLWIGVFVDRAKRRVYIFPLPCIGLVVTW